MKEKLNYYLNFLESLLAIVVLFGVGAYFVNSFTTINTLDWASIDSFYFFVNYVLALVVGIELAKLMITHDVYAITALLTFVVARKMLKPDLSSQEIFWGVVSFAILFCLNHWGTRLLKEKNQTKSSIQI